MLKVDLKMVKCDNEMQEQIEIIMLIRSANWICRFNHAAAVEVHFVTS